jgi:hypothetical protein
MLSLMADGPTIATLDNSRRGSAWAPGTPTPRIHVVYRSHGGENRKSRPPYFNKMVALASFARALDAAGEVAEVIYLNDGPILSDRLDLMAATGSIVQVQHGSNRGSYRHALRMAARAGWPDTDVVWFAEDDYLYQPSSLTRLAAGAALLPEAEYFAMYGLSAIDVERGGRRLVVRAEPGAAGDPQARPVAGTSWFRAMSTTSTFGVRAGVLSEDLRLLRACPFSGGAWDHTTCLTYQGIRPFSVVDLTRDLAPFGAPIGDWPRCLARGVVRLGVQMRSWRAPSRRRVLLGADPSPITHLEEGGLSRGTDWAALAEETLAWARAASH